MINECAAIFCGMKFTKFDKFCQTMGSNILYIIWMQACHMYSQVQKSLRKDDGKGSESLVALHFLEVENKNKERKKENVWKKMYEN